MSTHSLLLVGLGATVQDAGQSLIALAHRLDKEVEAWRDLAERMLGMTINGALCQEEDACRYCRPMWDRLRYLLDGTLSGRCTGDDK